MYPHSKCIKKYTRLRNLNFKLNLIGTDFLFKNPLIQKNNATFKKQSLLKNGIVLR